MSDLSFAVPAAGFKSSRSYAERRGFTPDLRFGGTLSETAASPSPETPVSAPEEESDPLSEAFTQGFTAGFEQAQQAAAQRQAADDTAREALMLALTRLDAELEEQLRLRLRETVAALCESAIAPLALDTDALVRRIEKAVAMLARADDERVIRLHPEDMALVSPRLAEQWTVQPDPKLTRGTIRVETASGGVEDGPATWRQAIAEALHEC
ncbi:flagellar assembly protein FliH [Novosphingobium sp. 1949]|uniref:Flagellar assembly protein FliH n=1 Tax=Novosphingobium organovorum TaxID=2930092 RepID=A0ABT0BJ34_9SPHN|nr:FliH/SctL family protein [Novosphingobium organovorum]MCJ2184831.1 flagellar assembly protein FliH [Novosphingobium organovorum]